MLSRHILRRSFPPVMLGRIPFESIADELSKMLRQALNVGIL